MKKIKSSILVGMVVCMLLLTACGGGATQEKTLRIAIEKTFNTLHQQNTTVLAEMEVIGQFMEGLMRNNKESVLSPAGAESYTLSDDGLVYTFNLRKEVKWTNGDAVSAKDYEYAWKELVTNKKAGFAYRAEIIKNAKAILDGEKDVSELGVKVVDDYTFEVTLERPYAAFVDLIATATFYPLHKATYEPLGTDGYGVGAETLMTNGPFTLTAYTVGAELKLKKSASYWDKANVGLENIDIKVIPELTTQSVLFNNKELDIIRIQGSLGDVYTDNENVVSQLENRLLYMYLSGTSKTPNAILANKNFRKAIAYSIDKSVITTSITKDGSAAQEGLYPKDFVKYDGKDLRDIIGAHDKAIYNTSKAQEYLQLAKQELGMETMSFDFGVQDLAIYKKIFENVKSQVENTLPGVTMNLNILPNQIYFVEALKKSTPAGMATWTGVYGDPVLFTQLFQVDSTYNYGQYNNATFEQKINSAVMERDPLTQAKLFGEAESVLIDDANFIPLYQLGAKYKLQDGIGGLIVHPSVPTIDYKYVTM